LKILLKIQFNTALAPRLLAESAFVPFLYPIV